MMADYKLATVPGFILRALDSAQIPMVDGNRDYEGYKTWLQQPGNVPDPADPAPLPDPQDMADRSTISDLTSQFTTAIGRLDQIQTQMAALPGSVQFAAAIKDLATIQERLLRVVLIIVRREGN